MYSKEIHGNATYSQDLIAGITCSFERISTSLVTVMYCFKLLYILVLVSTKFSVTLRLNITFKLHIIHIMFNVRSHAFNFRVTSFQMAVRTLCHAPLCFIATQMIICCLMLSCVCVYRCKIAWLSSSLVYVIAWINWSKLTCAVIFVTWLLRPVSVHLYGILKGQFHSSLLSLLKIQK